MKICLVLILFFSICFLKPIMPPYLTQPTRWAENILQTLTRRQKIGQLFIVASASNFEQPNEILAATMQASPYRMDEEYISFLIKEYYVGGVIFLFKSDPIKQMALTQKFQQQSSILLFITQDCEWGLSMRLDNNPSEVVRYPRNMTLGAIADEKSVYEIGYEIGKQCNALGVHINFAPVVDVNNNPENPVIHDRSFGDDPERVARLGELFMHGLQDAGIIACAKHFPGHGDTHVDSHSALPVIMHSQERLKAVEMVPFKKLIDEGVGAVMNAHLFLPAFDARENRPSSLSYAVVTQELKQKLGFQGLVITDGLGMQAITDHFKPGEVELEAFLAGNDILLCPLDVPAALDLIENAVISGRISEYELDARVLKILKAKEWAFKHHVAVTQDEALRFFVRPEAYALQEKVYTQALTCVKNQLTIHYSSDFVASTAVVTIGMNSANKFSELLEKYCSTSVSFSAQFSQNDFESCLESLREVETVIVGIGSFTKDVHKQFGLSATTLALLRRLKEQSKQLIVVIFGTPYSVSYCKDADEIIIAYEDYAPAHKAAAQFLLGEIKAEGKLPIKID